MIGNRRHPTDPAGASIDTRVPSGVMTSLERCYWLRRPKDSA
jgi:hypothetical protein